MIVSGMFSIVPPFHIQNTFNCVKVAAFSWLCSPHQRAFGW